MTMDLHPILDDILDDFLYCEMARVIHQGAKLESVLQLHQAKMEEVCHSIKAHDHWVHYEEYFRYPFTVGFVGKSFLQSLIEGGTGVVAT